MVPLRALLALNILVSLGLCALLAALAVPAAIRALGAAGLAFALGSWVLAAAGWTAWAALRCRRTPWREEPLLLSEEGPPDPAAPWRALTVDFAAVPEERRPAVRDELGAWVSVWRDPARRAALRLKALAAHRRLSNPTRLALTTFGVAAGGALLLPTLWQAADPVAALGPRLLGLDPRGMRFHALILLMLALGPWLRTLLACRRVAEVRRGDLRGVDVPLESVRFELWLRRQGRPFSLTMAGLLVGGFLIQVGREDQGLEWALDPARILGGSDPEPWRLLSAAFLHHDFLHLGFNAYALLLLGRFCEPLLGTLRTGLVYGLSLAAASAASLLLNQGPSLGASGAILGLLGAGLAVEVLHPRTWPRPLRTGLFAMAGLLAVFGALGHGIIDNAGHAGGLVGGFLATLWLHRGEERSHRPRDLVAFATLCILGFGLLTGAAKALFSRL